MDCIFTRPKAHPNIVWNETLIYFLNNKVQAGAIFANRKYIITIDLLFIIIECIILATTKTITELYLGK